MQVCPPGVKVNVLGRGIAEAVLTSFGDKRLDRKNHNPAPLVIVLAGNNRTGAYSLGAGRWLSLRGIRVLSVICAGEEEELDVPPLQTNIRTNFIDHSYTTEIIQKCRWKKSCVRRFTTYNSSLTIPTRNHS